MKKIISFLLVMCFICQVEAMDSGKLSLSWLTGSPVRYPTERYQDAFLKVFSKDNVGYVAQQGGAACSKLAKYSYRGVSWTAQTACTLRCGRLSLRRRVPGPTEC